ncbi:hypothetical protein ACFX15_027433 [Malus domestica]|uniref:Glutamate receptor n=1 Tax=Malus domestica TaxID=3750 RepID=A0A498KE34_MALDO|nr:hypothetical protein DVH24_025766 [Malus domestica]
MEFDQRKKQAILSIFLTSFSLVSVLYGEIEETHVGLILDMGSVEGKIVRSCISAAFSDFYHLHNDYSTRVVLHSRDSKGDPLHALSSVVTNTALHLLENIKVEAIIGAQTRVEANLLANLGEAAKVPILSFSEPSSPLPLNDDRYAFSVGIAQDETSQVMGINAIIEAFKWKDVILLYDNTEYGNYMIPTLASSFQQKNVYIAHKSCIAISSTNEQIFEELQTLMKLKTKVFVVHISHLLVPRLFSNVNKLGMMSEGYTWILTSASMNFLHFMDSNVIESMQGVIGLKSYIPASTRLQNLTSKVRNKLYMEDPNMKVSELSADKVWVYDATWALAEAIERASTKNSSRSKHGVVLLREILQRRFKGLSGEIQFPKGKLISGTLEIVNVIGKEARRVGFWFFEEKTEKAQSHMLNNGRNLLLSNHLKTIRWPGGSKRQLSSEIKLRIGVPVRVGFKELVRVEHDLQTNRTNVTGFSIDVFKIAISALPYKVHYEFFPFENETGVMAGTYNDLVHQVYLKNYDAVVGDITITSNRSQYVDFTMPYTDLGVGVLVPNQKDMWIFLKPLSAYLWITSACFFILTGFIVWVIERPVNQEFQGTNLQQIGTILWFSFSTLVFAQREKILSNWAKFVVIIWMFVVLILTSNYTATLASMMTVKQIQMDSIGNYIGYQSGSLGVTVNLNFKGMKPYRSAEEYADALSKGSKHGGVSAIIDELPYINIFRAKYSSDYSIIKAKSITNGLAFAFPKGSKLVEDLSTQIRHMREEGQLLDLEKTWFHRKTSLMPDDSMEDNNMSSPSNTLGLYDFLGLFLVSGVSSAVALFVFLIFSQTFRNLIKGQLQLIGGRLQRLRMFLSNVIST